MSIRKPLKWVIEYLCGDPACSFSAFAGGTRGRVRIASNASLCVASTEQRRESVNMEGYIKVRR